MLKQIKKKHICATLSNILFNDFRFAPPLNRTLYKVNVIAGHAFHIAHVRYISNHHMNPAHVHYISTRSGVMTRSVAILDVCRDMKHDYASGVSVNASDDIEIAMKVGDLHCVTDKNRVSKLINILTCQKNIANLDL